MLVSCMQRALKRTHQRTRVLKQTAQRRTLDENRRNYYANTREPKVTTNVVTFSATTLAKKLTLKVCYERLLRQRFSHYWSLFIIDLFYLDLNTELYYTTLNG